VARAVAWDAALRVSVLFFFERSTEPVLASGHWYSSPFVGVALFLAWVGLFTVVGSLMMRWDSGAPGAVWALVIALAILAACTCGVIWLYVH
jgi:hypothetical protein